MHYYVSFAYEGLPYMDIYVSFMKPKRENLLFILALHTAIILSYPTHRLTVTPLIRQAESFH